MKSPSLIYLYSRFERFWHWAQASLIIVLLVTGFEIHGAYRLLGFQAAIKVHNFCAWSWLGLYLFILFWMATTGEWKHYIPTFRKLFDVARFYLIGIFRGETHPVPKTTRAKHNPLQRLTYLGIVTLLVPFQILTGYLYYFYNRWPEFGLSWALGPVAILHTAGAFALAGYLIGHVYMTTTGSRLTTHLKSMFSGWAEVENPKGHEWEVKPGRNSSRIE